ncbi:MAG: toll/interleukin-1 receptor domain-containing protein [Oscillospiraceae bacterium]|nr:toll/interleukin-1 receptor domain-containing protein [Oscillospiraceae bacterium]
MEKRDFFISYTGRDEAWARWIAETLKDNGYTVYAQMLDIGPGDNFLDKMNEFLKNSGNFIAVWSEAYAKSRFCMTELQGAFHEWHKERINCLLPVRIDNHPMEPLYAGLVHVDLSDMGAASAEKLVDAVRYAVPHLLNQTALQEDAETLWQRGLDYRWGDNGVQQDYTKAREYWERAAAKGHVNALYDLGVFYSNGYGVKQDYAKAREYYEQAAAKGHASALYNLGYFYDFGYGLKQDYAKAREYYEQAAAKGHASALYVLGFFYDYAIGVKQDYVKAREYYEQAAAKGFASALWNLADLYEYGQGVSVDYAKALEYYQKAADRKVKELRKKLNR